MSYQYESSNISFATSVSAASNGCSVSNNSNLTTEERVAEELRTATTQATRARAAADRRQSTASSISHATARSARSALVADFDSDYSEDTLIFAQDSDEDGDADDDEDVSELPDIKKHRTSPPSPRRSLKKSGLNSNGRVDSSSRTTPNSSSKTKIPGRSISPRKIFQGFIGLVLGWFVLVLCLNIYDPSAVHNQTVRRLQDIYGLSHDLATLCAPHCAYGALWPKCCEGISQRSEVPTSPMRASRDARMRAIKYPIKAGSEDEIDSTVRSEAWLNGTFAVDDTKLQKIAAAHVASIQVLEYINDVEIKFVKPQEIIESLRFLLKKIHDKEAKYGDIAKRIDQGPIHALMTALENVSVETAKFTNVALKEAKVLVKLFSKLRSDIHGFAAKKKGGLGGWRNLFADPLGDEQEEILLLENLLTSHIYSMQSYYRVLEPSLSSLEKHWKTLTEALWVFDSIDFSSAGELRGLRDEILPGRDGTENWLDKANEHRAKIKRDVESWEKLVHWYLATQTEVRKRDLDWVYNADLVTIAETTLKDGLERQRIHQKALTQWRKNTARYLAGKL